jgi:transcriptional regulator with XRE-family HTH domain
MGRLRNQLDFDIGKRLRQLRVARGLSPEDLAKQTGFYAFHITEVETGPPFRQSLTWKSGQKL